MGSGAGDEGMDVVVVVDVTDDVVARVSHELRGGVDE